VISWTTLERAITGRVLLPGDPGFAAASRPVNKRHNTIQPAGVVSVATAADVATAIGWARSHDLPVIPRGGGHSYAGQSTTTGLVLDLRALNGIRVDGRFVTVGGGTTMGPLYAALRPHELAFPLGNSDDVGIGGLVLGGGVAAVSRAYGLTCDSLVETVMVLADGTTLTCNESQHPDLFWACRGGGGGTFGVNVSFTFQARKVADCATFLLLWHRRHAPDVLNILQDTMSTAPDELSMRIGVDRATVSAAGMYLGPWTELRDLLEPAIADPFRVDIVDRTYWDANTFLRHDTVDDPFAARTRFTAKPIGDAGITTLLDHLDRMPATSSPDGGGAALFSWGGAINRVPAEATAFPHRDTLFLLSMTTAWTEAEPPGPSVTWLTELHEAMREHTSDAAYLNFTDPDLDDWQCAYHGANYPRLAEIKRRYDPDEVFRSL
jgi:hypothetical protein